jgi:hypothetical protein
VAAVPIASQTKRHILISGSESRPMRRKDENMARIFAKRILRSIYGPIAENGIWRSRYNYELYKLYV